MAAPRAADCYLPLRLRAEGLVEHCRQLVAGDNQLWLPHFGFLATPLSRDWIAREPALQAVEQLCPIAQLGILQMPDHWVYHWHQDQNRQACINLLISRDHHSHTLFGNSVSDTSMHCLELEYEPGRFYLFNNQVPHSVINLDVNRFLFSLEFAEPVPYAELKQRFADSGLLDLEDEEPGLSISTTENR
jgi:hypothetical protein